MKKIQTVYQRGTEDRRFVTDSVTNGCEWVLAGEGTPTRKFDGVCCMLDAHGDWWARREVKPGAAVPDGFVEVERDLVTGKTFGWVPIAHSPFVKFHAEALTTLNRLSPGTYELCGPKVNGNPERLPEHQLIPHGAEYFPTGHGMSISELIDRARSLGWEGIVWHHPDGRMAKLKVRDYPKDAR